jgi:heat shock protein HspQ
MTAFLTTRQALFYHILIENERDTLKSILIK